MKIKIAIFGLGYVGLPLAVSFSKKYHTIGYDLNEKRINQLKSGIDKTLEVSEKILKNANNLIFTSELDDVSRCNFYIVTVPTPIDRFKNPDLTPLAKATRDIGNILIHYFY